MNDQFRCKLYFAVPILILLLAGCTHLPINLTQLDNDLSHLNKVWLLYSAKKTSSSFDMGLVQKNSENSEYIEIRFILCDDISNYANFKKYAISIYVFSNVSDECTIWSRTSSFPDGSFAEPHQVPIERINKKIQNPFSSNRMGISIFPKRIHDLVPFALSDNEWIGYKGTFNLLEQNGDFLQDEKGRIIILLSSSAKSIQEAYIVDNKWRFVKHVESGRVWVKEDEMNPDQLLNLVWSAWETRLLPFINQLPSFD